MGISDFHKMVVIVMKTHYKKQKAKTIQYRNYKHFHQQSFNFELNGELLKIDINNAELKEFNEIFLKVLDKHAPRKQKHIRANNSNYITKALRKEIMHKSRLRNKLLRERTKESKVAYNKQRNICVSLLRKSKRDYFANLDTKIMKDNRKFWKTVNPLFSEKSYSKESVSLINKDGLITENEDLAKTFNNFFSNIVNKLGIEDVPDDESNLSNIDDPISKVIAKYENHPSILRIKNYMKEKDLNFSFEFDNKPKISKEINKLDGKKACQKHDIPVKLIKLNKDLFSHFIYHNFNNSLFSSNFPTILKAADILPTHKNKDKSVIENYRPISILPTLSKIYERCMYDQMYKYFDQILSKYQCGFRQGYNTQHCQLMMVEKWNKALDKGGLGGALLTDLSKAFDCIKHDLLIAKLAAYGFDSHSLSFAFRYLNERKQRTKIHNSYSPYANIACGVPQGSILGPLLFNINICDMLFEKYECDIASYADDNTSHTYDSDLCTVLSKLKNCTDNLFTWFKENHMKPNGDKCNILVTTEKSVSVNIGGSNVTNKKEQKLLGIKFDSSLSFEGHITNLCKKASPKLHALARIINYMDLLERKVSMKAIVTSQFSYCPLIWMLHNRTLNNGINNIHERALILKYKDNKSSFKQLLEKDHSVTVHPKNLQVLVIEIFKVKNNLVPDIMKYVFELKEPPYKLRSESNHFTRRNVKTTYYGLLSIKHRAPQIWELVPQSIRKCKTLNELKTKIKSCYSDHCPCRLCKTHIAQLGFV